MLLGNIVQQILGAAQSPADPLQLVDQALDTHIGLEDNVPFLEEELPTGIPVAVLLD